MILAKNAQLMFNQSILRYTNSKLVQASKTKSKRNSVQEGPGRHGDSHGAILRTLFAGLYFPCRGSIWNQYTSSCLNLSNG